MQLFREFGINLDFFHHGLYNRYEGQSVSFLESKLGSHGLREVMIIEVDERG